MVGQYKYRDSPRGKSKESGGPSVSIIVLGIVLTVIYYLWPEDDSFLVVESFTKQWQCQETDAELKTKECIHEECNGVAQNYMGEALVFDVNSESKYPHLPIATANQCCQACKLHPNCNVWTYCRKPEGCADEGVCNGMLKKGARMKCTETGKFAYHTCTLKLHHGSPARWEGSPVFSSEWTSGYLNRNSTSEQKVEAL